MEYRRMMSAYWLDSFQLVMEALEVRLEMMAPVW
jgi:hypothetical protein